MPGFEPVLKAWKPVDAPPVVIVRWFVTEWCNYGCPYCPQTHGRREPKRGGFTAHAFDNHPLEAWRDAFLRHFARTRLSLTMTGGEPLLDKKNMLPLLRALTAMPTLENIRIDTNASWEPGAYAELDRSKVWLMCTFHPSEVDEDAFFRRVDGLLSAGFKIGIVNYVMTRENFARYPLRKKRLADRGIPLQPNPLWDARETGIYTAEDIDFFRRELPDADFAYRTRLVSPRGKSCLFPGLAYELDNFGGVTAGCHPAVAGSFFQETLPALFDGPVPCPLPSCTCLDKYSFLGEVGRNTTTNPLAVYSERLKAAGRAG